MTSRKVSDLQSARDWMNRMGMKHYGEVDHALAMELGTRAAPRRASGGGGAPPLARLAEASPSEQESFTERAAALLKDRRLMDADLLRALDQVQQPGRATGDSLAAKTQWYRALLDAKSLVSPPENSPRASTSIVGSKAVFNNDNYRVSAGDGTVNIYNKKAGENFTIWRSPGMDDSLYETQDGEESTALVLDDGTEVEIHPGSTADGAAAASCMSIKDGDYWCEVTGIAGEPYESLNIKESLPADNRRQDQFEFKAGEEPATRGQAPPQNFEPEAALGVVKNITISFDIQSDCNASSRRTVDLPIGEPRKFFIQLWA